MPGPLSPGKLAGKWDAVDVVDGDWIHESTDVPTSLSVSSGGRLMGRPSQWIGKRDIS
ncbi:hypothetical protein DRE_00723 [Drechslerella stenobrocha 248]|uniref:Uncharacterized protein n=1 Tax=Drechslerella stenobrocha 248 TaxID=1043628 RepID=W7HQ91_9PEZI|nr:hypothetical protein DRE_00723 [Drechslerella stenobrocha 248]